MNTELKVGDVVYYDEEDTYHHVTSCRKSNFVGSESLVRISGDRHGFLYVWRFSKVTDEIKLLELTLSGRIQ